jgi:hypothetical protein
LIESRDGGIRRNLIYNPAGAVLKDRGADTC